MQSPRWTKTKAEKYEEEHGEKPMVPHMLSNVKLATLSYGGTDVNGAEWYKYVLTGSAFYPVYKQLIYEVRPRENRMYLKTVTGEVVMKTRNETRAGTAGPMEWVSSGERVVGGVDSNSIVQKGERAILTTTELTDRHNYTHQYIIGMGATQAFINVGQQLTTIGFEDHRLSFVTISLLLVMGLLKYREVNCDYLPMISTYPCTFANPVNLTVNDVDLRFEALKDINDVYIKKTALVAEQSQCFAVANSKSNELIYMIDAKLRGPTITSGIRLFEIGVEQPLLVVGHFDKAVLGGCAVLAENAFDIGYVGAWAIADRDSYPIMIVYDYDRMIAEKHFAISRLNDGPDKFSHHICYVSWEQTSLLTRIKFLGELPVQFKALVLIWAMSVTHNVFGSDQLNLPTFYDIPSVLNYTYQALEMTQVLQDRTVPNAQELGRLNKINNTNQFLIKKIGRNAKELVDYYCIGDRNTEKPLFIIDSRERTGSNSFVTDAYTSETVGSIDAFRDATKTSHIHLNRECSIGYISGWNVYNISGVDMFFVSHSPKQGPIDQRTSFTLSPMNNKKIKFAGINWDKDSHVTCINFEENVGVLERFMIVLCALKVQFHIYETFRIAAPHSSNVSEARGLLGLQFTEAEEDALARDIEEVEAANQRMQSAIRKELGTVQGSPTIVKAETRPTSSTVKQIPVSHQSTVSSQTPKSPVIPDTAGIEDWPEDPSFYGGSPVEKKDLQPQPQRTQSPSRQNKTSPQLKTEANIDWTEDAEDDDSYLDKYSGFFGDTQSPKNVEPLEEQGAFGRKELDFSTRQTTSKPRCQDQTPKLPQKNIQNYSDTQKQRVEKKTQNFFFDAKPVFGKTKRNPLQSRHKVESSSDSSSGGHLESQFAEGQSQSSTNPTQTYRSGKMVPLRPYGKEVPEEPKIVKKIQLVPFPTRKKIDRNNPWGTKPGIPISQKHSSVPDVAQRDYATFDQLAAASKTFPQKTKHESTGALSYPAQYQSDSSIQTPQPTRKITSRSYDRRFFDDQSIFGKAKVSPLKLPHGVVELSDGSSSDGQSAQEFVSNQTTSSIKPTLKNISKKTVHLLPYGKEVPEESKIEKKVQLVPFPTRKKIERKNPWGTKPGITPSQKYSSTPAAKQLARTKSEAFSYSDIRMRQYTTRETRADPFAVDFDSRRLKAAYESKKKKDLIEFPPLKSKCYSEHDLPSEHEQSSEAIDRPTLANKTPRWFDENKRGKAVAQSSDEKEKDVEPSKKQQLPQASITQQNYEEDWKNICTSNDVMMETRSETSDGTENYILSNSNGPILRLTFSPDGKRGSMVATGTLSGKILFQVNNLQTFNTMPVYDPMTQSVMGYIHGNMIIAANKLPILYMTVGRETHESLWDLNSSFIKISVYPTAGKAPPKTPTTNPLCKIVLYPESRSAHVHIDKSLSNHLRSLVITYLMRFFIKEGVMTKPDEHCD